MEEEIEEDENAKNIEAAFPECKVLSLSKLTPNETGIANGDINYFDVSLLVSMRLCFITGDRSVKSIRSNGFIRIAGPTGLTVFTRVHIFE